MAETIITCGIFLYNEVAGKFLVCHATNSRWTQWSIPKGLLEKERKNLLQPLVSCSKRQASMSCVSMIERSFRYRHQNIKKQNKVLTSFLVIVDDIFKNHQFKSALVEGKDLPEVDSWKWITLEEGAKSVHESQAKVLENIRALIKQGKSE